MSNEVGKNRARFTFAELAEALNTEVNGAGEIFGVTTDSRAVHAGNLFIALRGEKFDGHSFLQQASHKGAVTVGATHVVALSLVGATHVVALSRTGQPHGLPLQVPDTLQALGALARFHRRRFQIPIVAVTGSYGKTTTRALIHAALSQKSKTLTSQGNFNNEIGLPMTLFQLESDHEAAVLEMGMRGAGQIDTLAKIAEPTVAVITNIGPQHIELLGRVENIAAAKAELLENLPENGLAVLPADSPFLEFLKEKSPCRVVTFGQSENADYRATEIQTQNDGTIAFSIRNPQSQICNLRLPLPGAHNAFNAAAAFAVAVELGVSPQDAARGLENAQIPGSRMRILKTGETTIIDDCYNAGPDSMRAALQTLLDFPGSGRRVAILGSMKELGDFSEAEHRKIGVLAGECVELLVGVGGETRPLLNAAIASAKREEREIAVFWSENAEEAAGRVGEWIKCGDVVLVKSSRSVGLEVVVEAVTKV